VTCNILLLFTTTVRFDIKIDCRRNEINMLTDAFRDTIFCTGNVYLAILIEVYRKISI
jgi:hypothetical protein